jgi:hypothetical protein
MFRALIYSDVYMPFITLVIYLVIWQSVKKKELLILLYCIFNVSLFSVCDVLAENNINNMPFYHINSLVETWGISFYILKKITGKNFSKAFWIINICYTIFFAFNVCFLETVSVFNSNSAGLASLIILFLCMQYLLTISKTDEILNFQKLPGFWIVSGFLIYNAVSILVLLSYKYFTYVNLTKESNNLWLVLSVAIIIKFALISTGLLCHRKRPATHSFFLL